MASPTTIPYRIDQHQPGSVAGAAESGWNSADLLRRLSAALARPGLRVILHTGDAPCSVRVNASLLSLVLEQVVCNAVEAMPNGGTLTLRAWGEQHRRCLSVVDSGPGLASEVRRHLFEP